MPEKIANRTVADEYFAVTAKVQAPYGQPAQLPADAAGPAMTKLRREHHRRLGNGYCTRPAELDCAFETVCETCTFFQTSIEFRYPAGPTRRRPGQEPHPPATPVQHPAATHQHRSIMIKLTRITHIMPLRARS